MDNELGIDYKSNIIKTELEDCYIIEEHRFGDNRGYFTSVTDKQLKALDFKQFKQKSESLSAKGTIRGLHYQKDPYCQAKVVSCTNGAVLDVVVDMRKDSSTYGKYTAVELTKENGRMLYVPRGFAHGFLALTDNATFNYMVDNEYAPKYEDGVLWNDPVINIPWDEFLEKYGIEKPILSEKDENRELLSNKSVDFTKKGKRFLITGYNGQLGYDIKRKLVNLGVDEKYILAIDKEYMDITNQEQVSSVISTFKPDVIFHCAAYTAVDKAESSGKLDCSLVNVIGTQNISEAANKVDAKLIYISTDYVFDGTKDGVYQVDDKVNPKNIYGLTKYLGEEEAKRCKKSFIVRTSWVFGINGGNFIKTMLRVGENKDKVSVVNDQVGSPTYTVDLAKLLVEMAYTDKYGTYHVNNEGYCSWAEFCDYFYKEMKYETEVKNVSTEQFYEGKDMSLIAYRPRNSRLDKNKLDESGFDRLPSWEDATKRYCKELKNSPIWETFRK